MNGNGQTIVLGISGSLRRGSLNTATLRAASELTPEGMWIELYDLAPIPLYNDDVYQRGFPPEVEEFRSRIREADGILIATPEFNYSMSGVLKNAIDWASRPPDQPFNGKPVAILGASPSFVGTARAQYHLRQSLVYLNGHALNQPEVKIGNAQALFDDLGRLTDDPTRERIRAQLAAFQRWIGRLQSCNSAPSMLSESHAMHD